MRLLDGEDGRFETRLLRVAAADAPPEDAMSRAAAALGLGPSRATTTRTVVTVAARARAKRLGIRIVGGVIVTAILWTGRLSCLGLSLRDTTLRARAPRLFNMDLAPNAGELILIAMEVVAVVLAFRGHALRSGQPSVVACAACVCLAWATRLGLHSLLFANGFVFYWVDDLIRFVQAYEWSRHPSFLAVDTPWLPGTQYLHGTAMRLVGDPLMASRGAAALSNLVFLVGQFLFSDGVFRDRRIAAATAVATGPWWLPTVLGTGALAEIPMCGFLLGGIGLLFYAHDAKSPRNRTVSLLLSVTCLVVGTTLHILAWVQVATVLAGVIIAWALNRDDPTAWSLRTALVICIGASSFAVAYLFAGWLQNGDPLFFTVEHRILERSTGLSSGWTYFFGVAFSVMPWSVALVGGIAKAMANGQRRAARALAGIGVTLGIMVVTSVRYGTTPTPYRSTILLTSALLPFAISIFFGDGQRAARRHGQRLFGALVTSAALGWGAINVGRTFSRQRLEDPQRSMDVRRYQPAAFALGAFLREELREGEPVVLTRKNLSLPIHVFLTDLRSWRQWIDWLIVVNRVGDPKVFLPTWLHPLTTRFDVSQLSDVVAGQMVVTDSPLRDARFRELVSFAPYRLYERTNRR